MRKNSFGYENLRAYCTYRVRGVNLDALLDTLARRCRNRKSGKNRPQNAVYHLKIFRKAKIFCNYLRIVLY